MTRSGKVVDELAPEPPAADRIAPCSNRFQREIGAPKSAVVEKVRPYMTIWVQDFVRRSPFLVMATANRCGDCDASPRGGSPGFVKILDDKRLAIPDYWGNRLFQSFANIDENPKCGLLFFLPGVNETVRINGGCRPLSRDEAVVLGLALEVHKRDDKTSFVQGLLVTVDEAYSHCPRSFVFADLWNPARITQNIEVRPIAPRPTRT